MFLAGDGRDRKWIAARKNGLIFYTFFPCVFENSLELIMVCSPFENNPLISSLCCSSSVWSIQKRR